MPGYCYRFLDDSGNVLYVGKTKNISLRLLQHKNCGHLADNQYDQVEKVQYMEFPTYNDAGLCERYFISKYNPSFNSSMTNEGKITFALDLSEYEWVDIDINLKSGKNQYPSVRNKNIINFERILKNVCMVDTTGHSFILYKLHGKPVEYFYCKKEDFEKRNESFKDSIWMPEDFIDDFLEYIEQEKIPLVYGWMLSDNGFQQKLCDLWMRIDKNNKKELENFKDKEEELTAECKFLNLNKLLYHPEYDKDYRNAEYRVTIRNQVKNYISNK